MRKPAPAAPAELAGIDLTDLDAFADGFPHEVFAAHRSAAPVWWHEPTAHTPDGLGFWSVATYAETLEVLRDAETYSSEHGGTMLADSPASGLVLNMMDDPRHNRIRRLVNKGLTPRMVALLGEDLARRTRLLLDAVPDGEPVDFLTAVAAELPMQTICSMLGVPEEDRHELFGCIEHLFDHREGRDAERAAAQKAMFAYGTALIAEKRAQPTDDMLSLVVHAELADVDPPRLSQVELQMFFNLLFAAGAETTRNAIAGGVLALVENPGQFAALRAEPDRLMGTAVEEIMRWTSPSPSKRRTATRDTELGGQQIAAGDKVLVWEGSANRDEAGFAGAARFDVRRDPNPHLAFGQGVHYCLGANLARLETRTVLRALIDTFGSVEAAGPAEWTRSNRHTGIRRLPLVFAHRVD
ncbi:cytochrome P450 [Yinghuangia soli]|uniref:Cytochrome P450 n=1 Tax=Yinghuangia soli TaxID=2908204 RepID=A0AA41TYE6_9ACTN|nr:cytochrome P450 [Yinghuangia soli]MCF2527743.1 cytochrome P450 [Yinghuangia soli]